MNEVGTDGGEAGAEVSTDAVEIRRVWNACGVEVLNKYQSLEEEDEEGEGTVECVECYVGEKKESEVCKGCASTDHWHDMPKLISSGEEDVDGDWKHIKQCR